MHVLVWLLQADTGACVSVVTPDRCMCYSNLSGVLQNTTPQMPSKLRTPGHHTLEVIGEFDEVLTCKERCASQKVFVINQL